MEIFKGKKVPHIEGQIPETQQECCGLDPCESNLVLDDSSSYDCGECLFDEKRCLYQLFEEWKTSKLQTNE